MSATSTIPHKRVFLGNIENIPSWTLRQTTPIKKKEVIPSASPVISNSDTLPLSSEESKSFAQDKPSHSTSSGSSPRYCYTREFILMFKDLPHCLVPPDPSPLEILKKYDEEHELNSLREKLAEAHSQRSSAHQQHHRAHNSAPSSSNSSPANIVTTSLTTATSTTSHAEKAALPASTANADRVIPLRISKASKEISAKPMFSPARRNASSASSTPITATTSVIVDNKENLPFASKEKRSIGLSAKSPSPHTPTSSAVSLKNAGVPSPRFAVKPKPDIFDDQNVAQRLIPTTPPATSVSLFSTPFTPFPGPTPNNTPVRGLLPSPATTMTSVVSPSILALLPVSMIPPNTPLCAVLVPPPSSSSPMPTLASPSFTQLYTALPTSPAPYIVSLSPSTPNFKINNLNNGTSPSPSSSTAALSGNGEALDVITARMKGVLRESDPKRLVNRQKQIDYGKATVGYSHYCELIPKSKRKREDPKTPNRFQICSKRSWDGQIRKWRRLLHLYDPPGTDSSKLEPELEDGEDEDDVDADDEHNTSINSSSGVDTAEVNIDINSLTTAI
eukprot:TRINITY_DN433_c0_g1_i1.p1 TRINITY_DN433_c0_g1~~TRINITY_DN433_c0_g1_i1.p1  ORF type:complete len:561 (-),score=148.38 TRINITY_DN433_c0_g1_i1:345-2027(-)